RRGGASGRARRRRRRRCLSLAAPDVNVGWTEEVPSDDCVRAAKRALDQMVARCPGTHRAAGWQSGRPANRMFGLDTSEEVPRVLSLVIRWDGAKRRSDVGTVRLALTGAAEGHDTD